MVDASQSFVAEDDAPAPPAERAAEPTSTRKRARMGIFVAIVIVLQVGPLATQVLELDVPLRGWRMFRGKGSDICDVRFTERDATGREQRRTVAELVDATAPRVTGLQAYRLNDVQEVRALARRYCTKSGASELRAVARCGDRERGWRRVLKETEDLCLPAP